MSVVVETVKMRFVRYRIRDPDDVQDIRSTHRMINLPDTRFDNSSFYTGSSAFKKAYKVIKQLSEEGVLARDHAYQSLLIYSSLWNSDPSNVHDR